MPQADIGWEVKVKTALQQSKRHANFLAVVFAAVLAVSVFRASWFAWVCVGLVAVLLAMEIFNIIFIVRRSRTNPGYLDEQIR